MIKDDQEGTRNPYKCMNVMKQDAMDDKIIDILLIIDMNKAKDY